VDRASHDSRGSGFFSARANIVLVAFLAIAAFFLVTEHRAHLIPYLGYWPFLLILACPLLHLFMHHGHGDNGGPGDTDDRDTPPHQH